MNSFGDGFDAAMAAAKQAWERMETIRFRPFDLGKWFMLGFAAWLATLGEQGGGGFSNVTRLGDAHSKMTERGKSSPALQEILKPVTDWCHAHAAAAAWIIAAVVVVILLLIALTLVFCWINSRGKFMLLDNVVRNDQRITEPWAEFRAEGNSLFWWRFWYGLAVLLPLTLVWLGGTCWMIADLAGYALDGVGRLQLKDWLMVALVAVLLLIPCLLASIPPVWLRTFGVPLMYKYRLTATAALAYVWSLFKARWKWFVAYWILGLGIGLAWGLAIIAAVLVTCCIAGCLMAIPYLGAVLLLPLTVFYMAWRVYFLQQVHPELQLFTPPQPPPLTRTEAVTPETPAPQS